MSIKEKSAPLIHYSNGTNISIKVRKQCNLLIDRLKRIEKQGDKIIKDSIK